MKRAIVAGAIVASLALAGPASAATPTERKLQREVNTLKKDVAALKKQVRELNEGVAAFVVFSVCSTAITADAFQGTWAVLDQKTGSTPVGPQQPVNDSGACNALQVPRSGAGTPNLNSFHALLRLLQFRSLFG